MQLLLSNTSPQSAGVAARPYFDGAMAAAPEQTSSGRWHVARINEDERHSAEKLIAAQFMKAYRARITEFMPDLMGLYDGNNLAAACGLRIAADGPMFLEQYLETPAEAVLEDTTALTPDRRRMVEVGNLSISRPGYARHLVYWLTMHLRSIGMQWAIFSAVPALRNNFRRLGVPLVTLGPASPEKLRADVKASWGSYYDQKPLVTAVSVDASFHALGGHPCLP